MLQSYVRDDEAPTADDHGTRWHHGIRVLLAGLTLEWHNALRDVCLRVPDFRWVARAPSLPLALEEWRAQPHDVLVLEVPFCQPECRLLLADLQSSPGGLRWIAYCPSQDDQALHEAVTLGASALISSSTPPEFTASAIRRVHRGERPIEYDLIASSALARNALGSLGARGVPRTVQVSPPPLTPRQLGILSFLADGLSNKQIADRLALQEQTVKNYVSKIMRRIEATDRVQAVVLALHRGWITAG